MVRVFFRHGGVALLTLAVAALLGGWLGGVVALSPGAIVVGALMFYLSEYGMHRFAFHAPPSPWPFMRRLQHRLHYDHHSEPNRLELLFLPWWFLLPNLTITAALVGAIAGAGEVAPVMLGVMLAILHYEWAHYVAHVPYQPRTRAGRWIKSYHLRHHYISEFYWFGVSNPSMDFVGGTYRDPKQVEKSATVRQIGEGGV
jgi:hypothetical protein